MGIFELVVAMHSKPDLIDKFRGIDADTKRALAGEKSKLKLGLAALVLAQEEFGIEYLPLDDIVEALDRMGVAVERTEVGRAFSRAEKRVRRVKQDGMTLYKAMTPGRDEVQDLIGRDGSQVIYIEGGKPRTARKALAGIFEQLKGEVRICDPYYGLRTLDALEMLPKTCKVRFLSAHCSDKASLVHAAVADFKRENPHVAIGVYPLPKEIHDRYVLTADELLLVGHGIKDIGNKESLVVRLDGQVAQDLIASMTGVFDERWKKVTLL